MLIMNTVVSKTSLSDVIVSKANVIDIQSKTYASVQSKTDFCPTSVSRFLQACRANTCEISEDEIVDDVRQIRYQKACMRTVS